MIPDDHGLQFPADRYVGADGRVALMRIEWTRDGADRYIAAVEAQQNGAWRPLWRIAYARTQSVAETAPLR